VFVLAGGFAGLLLVGTSGNVSWWIAEVWLVDLQGQRIDDRYLIGAVLGEGADAVVYYALDRHLRRTVAIKLLRPELCIDPTFVARFEREARSAGRLSHPNIVPIYDYGEALGTHYLVMEYVRGGDLRGSLEPGQPLPVDTAVRVAAEVAGALGAAHAWGVVHRDVKPANVLLTERGQAKVTDFGIAKMLDVPALTPAAVLLGTPHYLAPEQAGGGTITPATDVYALGVMLYEMLAGRRPFLGDSLLQVAMQHLHQQPPPLADFNPAVPPGLAALVARALAKDPARRFADGAALSAALRALGPAGGTVVTARSYSVRRWPSPGAGPVEQERSWSDPAPTVRTAAGNNGARAGSAATTEPAARREDAGWGRPSATTAERPAASASAAWGPSAVLALTPAGAALRAPERTEAWTGWQEEAWSPLAAVRAREARLSASSNPYTRVAVVAVGLALLVGGLVSGRLLLGGDRAVLTTSVQAPPPVVAAPPAEPAPAPVDPAPAAIVRERPIVTLDPAVVEEPTPAPAQAPAPSVAPDSALPRTSYPAAAPPTASPPAAAVPRVAVVDPAPRAEPPSASAARARVAEREASVVAEEAPVAEAVPIVEPEPPAVAPAEPPAAPTAQPAAPPQHGYGPGLVRPPAPLPPPGLPPPFPVGWGPPGPLPPRPGPPMAMPPLPMPPLPPAAQQPAAGSYYSWQHR